MSEVKITKELLEHLLDMLEQGYEITRYVAEVQGMVYNITDSTGTTIVSEQFLLNQNN